MGVYFITSFYFEYKNSPKQLEMRTKSISNEIHLSIVALVLNVSYVMTWNWLIDPYTPYYG
jgi:hypothetical protein